MAESRQASKAQPDGRGAVLKILLAAAALFYALFIWRTSFQIGGQLYFTLIDDAMVSMRYAQHLAQGFGLVWNVGEKPVEGFTNPGWMLFMAALHLLPLPAAKVSAAVMAAAAAILLANAVVVYKICEALDPRASYAPLMAAGITAFYFPLVFWSLRGMEVGILTLLVDIGVLLSARRINEGWLRATILLCLVFFLAITVRLDAILQVAVVAAYVVSTRRMKAGAAALPVSIAILTAIGILAFQRLYFGDFLPNTYYQKVVGASLAERVKNGILVFNDYATRDTLMMVLVSAAGVILYKDLRRRETTMLAVLFLVQCAYSISVGGDYAEPEVGAANRFITQGMPALIILFSLAVDHLIGDAITARGATGRAGPGRQNAIALGVAAAALLVISGQPWVNWAIDNAPLLKADIRRVKAGLAIAQYTSPEATIAVHAAGQIPYYSGRRTIDLLGLNDPVVAKGPVTGPFYPGHDKWNYDYSILRLKPDLIADNWTKLGDFIRGVSEYQQLDNGMYVRKDSTLVDVAGLSKAFP